MTHTQPAMSLPPAPPMSRPPARRQWLWLGLSLFLLPVVTLGVIALGVASCFQPSSDTRALRNGLMKASDVEWRQNIGLNLGSVTLGVVRAGLSFAPFDSEARAAVQAVRGVEVGIYELAPGIKPPDCATMLAVADTVLNARGWERVVGVLDGEDLVGVYVPGKVILARQVKCCVLVFDGRQMVLASGRANVEPLLQCLRKHSERRSYVGSGGSHDLRRLGLVAAGGPRGNEPAGSGW